MRTCHMIEFAVPLVYRGKIKEIEKINKLCQETKNAEESAGNGGMFRMVPKYLGERLKDWKSGEETRLSIQ